MSELNPREFVDAIVVSMESQRQRPVRIKKVPSKFIDSVDTLTDVYNNKQLCIISKSL